MMNYGKAILFISVLFFCANVFAQTVSTLVGPSVQADDGMVVDASGNVYVSQYSGSTVSKITPDGTISVLADGFVTPNGLEIDPENNIYVADAFGSAVYRISQAGDIDTLATGLTRASGLAFNATYDTLYVAQYSVSKVSKLALDGTFADFVTGNGLNGPVGIDCDSEGNLIVGNFNDGDILRISLDGTVETIANVTPFLGFVAVIKDHIFATSLDAHQIFRVNPDGEVDLFAGTGAAGLVDGPAASAEFDGPNGVAASVSGDTLYVSDWNTRAVRRIVGDLITDIEDAPAQVSRDFALEQNYPNPFNPSTVIPYRISTPNAGSFEVTASIFNLLGQEVAVLFQNKPHQRGRYEAVWDGLDQHLQPQPSGIYFVRLDVRAANQNTLLFSDVKRMTLIR